MPLAVIKVLEAPLFEDPDDRSLVIKHLRKGSVIELHPSSNRERKYDKLRPEPFLIGT